MRLDVGGVVTRSAIRPIIPAEEDVGLTTPATVQIIGQPAAQDDLHTGRHGGDRRTHMLGHGDRC